MHRRYLAESKRAGRPLVYSALLLALLATFLYASQQPLYLTMALASSSAILIGLGTYVRLRLISMHRGRIEPSS